MHLKMRKVHLPNLVRGGAVFPPAGWRGVTRLRHCPQNHPRAQGGLEEREAATRRWAEPRGSADPLSPADRPWLTESKKVQKLQDKIYVALQHEIQKKHSAEDKLSKVAARGHGAVRAVAVPGLVSHAQAVFGG